MKDKKKRRFDKRLLIGLILISAGVVLLLHNFSYGIKVDIKEEEPIPFKEEEVVFTNTTSDITLAGTLTLPEKSGKHPAVIMLTGSGPVNRDEEAFGMKPFRIIADHFTRKGIAVLRYDSRGVGGSTGDVYQSTFFDFSEDAQAAIRYLKTRSDINPAQIGLCGHSQGGAVAPLTASQSKDVAFIICISGFGHIGEEIFIAQNELIERADGAAEKEIKEYSKTYEFLFNLIRKGASEAKIKSELLKLTRKKMGSTSEEEKKILKSKVNCMLNLFTSRWFKFFLDYDPIPVLKKVKCPVLLLFGELDLQVPAEMNKKAMVEALKRGGNNDYSVKIFPKANHLFQSAKTGSPSEYNDLAKEFVPGFLEFMSDWILQQVDIVK